MHHAVQLRVDQVVGRVAKRNLGFWDESELMRSLDPLETDNFVKEIVRRHADSQGASLLILQALQAALGYVPESTVPIMAEALNLTRAEVHGIVTFYHDFRRVPPGRHILKLCRAEACQAMGADALAEHVRERLEIDWHQTTKDGAITLEPVYCLGLCACGPSALWDNRPRARLDKNVVDTLLETAE